MAAAPNGDAHTSTFRLHTQEIMTPTLSEVARIMHNGMQNFFREVNVDVASCPCLTREPFNLAGVGLCGNTSLIQVGGYSFSRQVSWFYMTWNLKELLSATCYDSFIIGTGYAAKLHMPYNGHLIINATYRAPMIIRNASRIVFAETGSGQRRIETLTDRDPMICSFMGNFFVSEGREGNVLRVRAKGRKSEDVPDIITAMQIILHQCFNKDRNGIIALGGVLKMRNGKAAHYIMPEEYPSPMPTFHDFIRQYQYQEITLDSELIAVGTIDNSTPTLLVPEQGYTGSYLIDRRHQFYSYSDYGAGGQFINDTTPDMTEYEGYFNLAKKISYVNYYE